MNKLATALNSIIQLLSDLNTHNKVAILDSKEIWTLEELLVYTGFKRSHILHLTSENEIPFSKPNGKKLFFERDKIHAWLKDNDSLKDHQLVGFKMHRL